MNFWKRLIGIEKAASLKNPRNSLSTNDHIYLKDGFIRIKPEWIRAVVFFTPGSKRITGCSEESAVKGFWRNANEELYDVVKAKGLGIKWGFESTKIQSENTQAWDKWINELIIEKMQMDKTDGDPKSYILQSRGVRYNKGFTGPDYGTLVTMVDKNASNEKPVFALSRGPILPL